MELTGTGITAASSMPLWRGVMAWGDAEAIATRVQSHRDAGADSTCIQVLQDGPMGGIVTLPVDTYRELAPALC
jgi:hypothetical protein